MIGSWVLRCTDDDSEFVTKIEAGAYDLGMLAEARTWPEPDPAVQITEDGEPEPWLEWVQVTLRLAAETLIDGIMGNHWTDVEGHWVDELDSLEACPFMSVEHSTRDSRVWISFYDSPVAAAEASYNQECYGDWTLEEVIDVRSGDRYRVRPTWTAELITEKGP